MFSTLWYLRDALEYLMELFGYLLDRNRFLDHRDQQREI